jgi:hypothetical protein
MSQHDFNLANASGASFRSDLNNAFVAIASNSSGTVEPTTKFANQWWMDTTTHALKVRNEANDNWISLVKLDQSNNRVDVLFCGVGTVGAPGLAIANDTDTGIYGSASNTLAIAAGGVLAAKFNTLASGVDAFSFTPGKSGTVPIIAISGSTTNQDMTLTPAGTGKVNVPGLNVTGSNIPANGVYLPTTNTPGISANSIVVARFNTLAVGVDYFSFTPGKSGTAPVLAVAGSTTNQDLTLSPAGTGQVNVPGLNITGSNVPTDGFYNAGSHRVVVATNGTGNRFSITSNGSFFSNGLTAILDTSSDSNDGFSFNASANLIEASNDGNNVMIFRRRNSDGGIVGFRRNTTNVGAINVTTTSTSYVTSSDARLKEKITPLKNSGVIIDALNPVCFTWKYAEGNPADIGFIAQDLHKVVPKAVMAGDNDMALKPGDKGFQQWMADGSALMPYVIAELQSLRRRVSKCELN